MPSHTSFTSESVCAGHPDKLCDQISDAILDAILSEDPHARVAVESLAAYGKVFIAGEITANARIDYAEVAREQIRRLGYTDHRTAFSDKSTISVDVHEQSPEIAAGVKKKGAGDQGMMFGYACRETTTLMPLPITLSHRLARKIDELREGTFLDYLRPDGKTQVTVAYKNGKPDHVKKVVMAAPHSESVSLEQVKEDLYKNAIIPVLAEFGYEVSLKDVIVNGTGVWHHGGPAADTGLTGRKIVVDTYGGYARVGGGCFSGKDPSKVDRSGAYAARFIAKNIVARGMADEAEVSLAYYIGAKKPLMQEVETFGTAKTSQKEIENYAAKLLDTSVEGILEGLKLRRPIYLPTAAYGHFGREEFPWEAVVA